MSESRKYLCLNIQSLISGNYSIVPIRNQDRHLIRKWRNSQIEILRQKAPISVEEQDNYFEKVVSSLFFLKNPNQLLFSFFEGSCLIGYGGLVHIDWESRNGEISFLIETERNANIRQFKDDWSVFLDLMNKIAFEHLNFHKIYTYAYDIRPHYFEVLKVKGFCEEARLKSHIFINDKLYDVRILSLFNVNEN